MNLGNTVTKLREQKGLKQGQLADILGITPTYLSKIENNRKIPNIPLLEKLAQELSIPLPFLFFLSAEERDFPEKKRPMFRFLQPAIQKFITDLIEEDDDEHPKP